MLIRLDVDYVSDYVFWPVYSMDGKLVAAEMVIRFNSLFGNASILPDIIFSMLTQFQRHDLIKEEIEFIKQHADWFIQHDVILVIKIDREIADFLMESPSLFNEIKNLPFIELEINEHFPHLSEGKGDDRIRKLSESFNLWLDNFGSGKVNMKPLNDGCISAVKMDQTLVWYLLSRPAKSSIMDPLLRVIRNNYQGVRIIAKGIDTHDYLTKAKELNIDAMQGGLCPAVHFDALETEVDFSYMK